MKRIFEDACPTTELATTEIVQQLVDMDDRPWPEMGRSHRPLSAARFTQMLGKFGIQRRRLVVKRTNDHGIEITTRPWGYRLTDFGEAFGRYLDA